MKISKAFWIFLTAAVLIGASVWLFMQYNNATKDRSSAEQLMAVAETTQGQLAGEEAGLNAQLSQADEDIKQWQARITLLRGGMTQAEAGLEQARSALPGGVENLDYDELLLVFARAAGLEVLSLETSGEDELELAGHAGFVTTTFVIHIKGDVSDILDLYARIVTDTSFRTGLVGGVVFELPLPMTDAEKAALAEDFYAELLADIESSFTAEQRVLQIEQAVLDLLGESYEHITVAQMTERVREAMAAKFGPEVANKLAQDIALALEEEVADTLVSTIASIYGEAAGALFAEGEPQLTPIFLDILGPDIVAQLQNLPVGSVPGVVSNIIVNKINAMIQARVEAMVDRAEIARRIAVIEADSQKAGALIAVSVVAYPGGSNG